MGFLFGNFSLIVTWLYVLLVAGNVLADNHTDLYFSFMLSRAVDGVAVEQDTSGVAPAVKLAL